MTPYGIIQVITITSNMYQLRRRENDLPTMALPPVSWLPRRERQGDGRFLRQNSSGFSRGSTPGRDNMNNAAYIFGGTALAQKLASATTTRRKPKTDRLSLLG